MRRQLFTIPLAPMIGDRFQPTGFPNLGAAEFERPVGNDGWQRCLLVESAQSMANRFEATLWDGPNQRPDEDVAELPHIEIRGSDGQFLTSSRLEAHRIASAYIRKGRVNGQKATDVINGRLRLENDRQRAPFELAEGVFGLDPMCLVHGVFLSDKAFPGQPKIPRAVSAVIEARDVREAHSGGVKKDSVFSSAEEGRGATEGFGMVPFDRTEWTAREIVATVALDLDQIRSYGLSESATNLLADVARLEIRRLFDGGLRLRTACDLRVVGEVVDQSGEPLPDVHTLSNRVREGIQAVAALIGEGNLVVTWDGKK